LGFTSNELMYVERSSGIGKVRSVPVLAPLASNWIVPQCHAAHLRRHLLEDDIWPLIGFRDDDAVLETKALAGAERETFAGAPRLNGIRRRNREPAGVRRGVRRLRDGIVGRLDGISSVAWGSRKRTSGGCLSCRQKGFCLQCFFAFRLRYSPKRPHAVRR